MNFQLVTTQHQAEAIARLDAEITQIEVKISGLNSTLRDLRRLRSAITRGSKVRELDPRTLKPVADTPRNEQRRKNRELSPRAAASDAIDSLLDEHPDGHGSALIVDGRFIAYYNKVTDIEHRDHYRMTIRRLPAYNAYLADKGLHHGGLSGEEYVEIINTIHNSPAKCRLVERPTRRHK